jgi:hypothetical protein
VADAGIIGSEVSPDKHTVTASRCIQDVGFDVYTSTGSSLHAMSEKSAEYLTMLMQFRETHLKIIQRLLQSTSDIALASIGTTSARNKATAPLQSHLHSAQSTPRDTSHHTLSPAPCLAVGHVHLGGRSDQALAHSRNTTEHDVHWNIRRKLNERMAMGWQRLLPKALVD